MGFFLKKFKLFKYKEVFYMFDNYNPKPSFNYDFVFKAIKGSKTV